MNTFTYLILIVLSSLSIYLPLLIYKAIELKKFINKNKIISLSVLYFLSIIILSIIRITIYPQHYYDFYNIFDFLGFYFILWSFLLISYTTYFYFVKNFFLNKNKYSLIIFIISFLIFIIILLLLYIPFLREGFIFIYEYEFIIFLLLTILFGLIPFLIFSFKIKKVFHLLKIILIVLFSITLIYFILHLFSLQNNNYCNVDSDCKAFNPECSFDCNFYPDLVNKNYLPLLQFHKKINCMFVNDFRSITIDCFYFGFSKEPYCNKENRCDYRFKCDNCRIINYLFDMNNYYQSYENYFYLRSFLLNNDYFLNYCECDIDICDILCFDLLKPESTNFELIEMYEKANEKLNLLKTEFNEEKYHNCICE